VLFRSVYIISKRIDKCEGLEYTIYLDKDNKRNYNQSSKSMNIIVYNSGITQPTDKGIKLIDILEDTEMIGPSAIRGRRLNKATILGRRLNDKGKREDYNKEIPITQCLEVRATNRDKSNCLTTVAKDNVLTTMPIGRHPDAFKNNLPFRYYTIKEYCRLQTVPENYFDGVASENQIRKMIGNGWTVDVISHIFGGIKSK
jgi:site-specific DNA-cytosine methylase